MSLNSPPLRLIFLSKVLSFFPYRAVFYFPEVSLSLLWQIHFSNIVLIPLLFWLNFFSEMEEIVINYLDEKLGSEDATNAGVSRLVIAMLLFSFPCR